MIIGVVGPPDSLKRIMEFQSEVPQNVLLKAYEALTLKDAVDVAETYNSEMDGILFSGPSVHGSVISKLNVHKPNSFIPHSGFGLLSLFYNQIDSKYTSFSIDVIASDAPNIMPIKLDDYHFDILSYEIYHSENDYIIFHEENLKNGSDAIVTTFASIYTYFTQKNIPVYRLHTTDFDIRYTLKALIHEIEKVELSLQNIAVQKIKVSLPDSFNKYQNFQRKLDLEIELNAYTKNCDGTLIFLEDVYTIYSTKKHLNSPLIHSDFFELMAVSDNKIYSGIAYGSSVYQAELNAETALNAALSEDYGNLYILDDNLQLRGPFTESPFSLVEPILDKEIIEDASHKIGLSEDYIYKIYRTLTLKDIQSVTAKEFAHYLNISHRSANRILRMFINAGYGKIIDSIHEGKSGRPINVIKITL